MRSFTQGPQHVMAAPSISDGTCVGRHVCMETEACRRMLGRRRAGGRIWPQGASQAHWQRVKVARHVSDLKPIVGLCNCKVDSDDRQHSM